MAKISAHGSTKLAEGFYDFNYGGSLGAVRTFYVLRSDGVILRASSYPFAQRAYDRKRSGYTVAGRFKPGKDVSVERFQEFVSRRAARMESVAVFK